MAAEEEDQDAADDVCAVCDIGGELVSCDRCVHSFHKQCVDVDPDDEDNVVNDEDAEFECATVGWQCTERTERIILSDSDEDDDSDRDEERKVRVEWIGGPKARKNGDTFYGGFRLGGVQFRPDDNVQLLSGTDQVWVMCLDSMWEDCYGDQWVIGRWYYCPEDTQYGRLAQHHAAELFLSTLMDPQTMDKVVGPVTIVQSVKEYNESAKSRGEDDPPLFVCSRAYNEDTGEFRPLLVRPTKRRKKKENEEGEEEDKQEGDNDEEEDSEEAEDIDNVFARACRQLQLSSVPAKLPCRERERKKVYTFLRDAIKRGGQTGGLYMSGVPGTGKTATVRQVVAELSRNKTLPPFRYIEINSFKLPDPNYAYSVLYKELEGKHASPARASVALERRFSSSKPGRVCYVVLVDELDFLLTKDQKVMFNLFDWPRRRHARLVVLGIANTMDLPERLHPRVQSRLGTNRVVFKSYTRAQIQTIVTQRLMGLEAFDKSAIELCALKTAAISGDVRRALQICRRAAELCERDGDHEFVSVQDIEAAVRDLYSSVHVQVLERSTMHQKFFLAALLLEARTATLTDEYTFVRLYERHRTLCRTRGIEPIPPRHLVLDMARALAEVQIIAVESKVAVDRDIVVRLNVSKDDICFALRDDDLWQSFNIRV